MKTKETLKASELVGIVITNTGRTPSTIITEILPPDNVGHFRTDYNYVIRLDNKLEKHTVESLQLTKTFPKEVIFEKSTRELALEWWNNPNFLYPDKTDLVDKYLGKRQLQNLTGREIEEIWRKETQDNGQADVYIEHQERFEQEKFEQQAHLVGAVVEHKPNQKQFKEFSPELFKAYIGKFSDEDKRKAFDIIFEYLPLAERKKIFDEFE